MGNCTPKPKKRPTLSGSASGSIRLCGSESCPLTLRIRLALLYKSVDFHFIPSELPGGPVLRFGPDSVSGSADAILAYLDSRFPGGPRVAAQERVAAAAEDVAAAVGLQHRSVERHVGGMARWAAEMGAATTEGRRMARSYGQLVEVMLEHAQMEERLLFPALESAAHRGICNGATEEHARDLPIMNGIKEDVKSLLAMDSGSAFYHEALLNLQLRFKTLEEHCKEHFEEEERQLLPLLAAAERAGREEGKETSKWVEQMVELMEATHTRQFHFFMAGLLPQEAMQYVHLLCRCIADKIRVAAMLRTLVSWLEAMPSPSLACNTPSIKYL